MPNGTDMQPVNSVTWIHRGKLKANSYNPNHVAPRELELLKISILEDGWTQPIVARKDGEIVDGYHRWLVSEQEEIYFKTDGYVPVVYLEVDEAGQRMATIRHNRARGTHYVLRMSEIVQDLIDNKGLTFPEVSERLQMEEEEIDRLYDHAGMTIRGSKNEDFNQGWVPTNEGNT